MLWLWFFLFTFFYQGIEFTENHYETLTLIWIQVPQVISNTFMLHMQREGEHLKCALILWQNDEEESI